MIRKDLLLNTRDVLASAGFYVSDVNPLRLTGFDVVARRDNLLLIIKVLANIDSLSEEVARELRTLSFLLKATPLVIGEKNGSATLEDDVVYLRCGIQAITLNTLNSHLLEGIPIHAYAGPGGLYVKLDEEKIQKLRQERNFSLGTFARHVHVSRRTVRLYESGMNARIDVATRIEELFDCPVTLPIDILQVPTTYEEAKTTSQIPEKMREFQREIFSFLQTVGYHIIPMGRCPFEAVSKERNNVLLTCVDSYNKRLLTKAQIVGSISKITEKRAVVFTDHDAHRKNVQGTPLIVKKDLKKIKDPEDVLTLILERT